MSGVRLSPRGRLPLHREFFGARLPLGDDAPLPREPGGLCFERVGLLKGAKSPVLLSMGLPAPVVDGALRASFIYGTSEEELDMLVSALREGIARVAHK